jgi:ribosome-binding protein aMBF1 (putative translation factor)
MKTWDSVKKNIKSLTDDENRELDLVVEIVSQIIARRVELGISQRELAEKSGVKQSAIARLESFKVTPQIDTIAKIIKPLGLKITLIAA